MFGLRTSLVAAVVAAGLVAAGPALGAETVSVSLWDKGDQTQMPMDLGIGMAGDHATATMGIAATPASVKAGDVTFEVKNDSALMIHEMVVIPLASADAAPPFDDREMAVNEDAAGALGEVEELEPGKSGSVTLTLAAGTYALICNVPGHYAGGMWAILTVTR